MCIRLFVSVCILAAIPHLSVAQQEKKPLGETIRDQDHGELVWKSTAVSTSVGSSGNPMWRYERSVSYKGPKARCMVYWEDARVSGPVEQGNTRPGTVVETDTPPHEQTTPILYDGGDKPGFGIGDTRIWSPESTSAKNNPRSCTADATLLLLVDNKATRVDVKAASHVILEAGEYRFDYEFEAPEAGKNKETMRVRWDSITSPDLAQAIENKSGFLELDADGKFSAHFKTTHEPVFRNQSVRFMDTRGHVRAVGWLPALAPDSE